MKHNWKDGAPILNADDGSLRWPQKLQAERWSSSERWQVFNGNTIWRYLPHGINRTGAAPGDAVTSSNGRCVKNDRELAPVEVGTPSSFKRAWPQRLTWSSPPCRRPAVQLPHSKGFDLREGRGSTPASSLRLMFWPLCQQQRNSWYGTVELAWVCCAWVCAWMKDSTRRKQSLFVCPERVCSRLKSRAVGHRHT